MVLIIISLGFMIDASIKSSEEPMTGSFALLMMFSKFHPREFLEALHARLVAPFNPILCHYVLLLGVLLMVFWREWHDSAP